jgi:hypothetical protein
MQARNKSKITRMRIKLTKKVTQVEIEGPLPVLVFGALGYIYLVVYLLR